MAIKRSGIGTELEREHLKTAKRACSFDDSSIRKMLRSAYEDFVGDELEAEIENYIEPTYLGKKRAEMNALRHLPDLKIFWDMYVQKQLFCFDQESTLLLGFSRESEW